MSRTDDEMAEMTGGAEDWREVLQALHDGFVAGFEYGLAEIERIERDRGEYREARVMSPLEPLALAFEELRDSIEEAMGDAERL